MVREVQQEGTLFVPSQRPAYEEILRVLRENEPDTISVVVLGPMTNVALAAAKEPEVFLRAKEIVVMGGAIKVPGNVWTQHNDAKYYLEQLTLPSSDDPCCRVQHLRRQLRRRSRLRVDFAEPAVDHAASTASPKKPGDRRSTAAIPAALPSLAIPRTQAGPASPR